MNRVGDAVTIPHPKRGSSVRCHHQMRPLEARVPVAGLRRGPLPGLRSGSRYQAMAGGPAGARLNGALTRAHSICFAQLN
jgi:hypothetical protein